MTFLTDKKTLGLSVYAYMCPLEVVSRVLQLWTFGLVSLFFETGCHFAALAGLESLCSLGLPLPPEARIKVCTHVISFDRTEAFGCRNSVFSAAHTTF